MNIRDRFTKNAEEFDSLMVEMLEENKRLETKLNKISYIDKNQPFVRIGLIDGSMQVISKAFFDDVVSGKACITDLDGFEPVVQAIIRDWMEV